MESATLERLAQPSPDRERMAQRPATIAAAQNIMVTHQHLFQLIWTLIEDGTVTRRPGPLRILDIGCGDGRLMASLTTLFKRHLPETEVEVHGFDIGEQGYADNRQQDETIQLLQSQHFDVDWATRIRLVRDGADWGYPAGHFDIAVSNQVIEHVDDLPVMIRRIRQAVRPGGAALHLFPLSSCIEEAHCLVPFAHWIRDFDHRVAWLSLMSRFGIGRYKHDRAVLGYQTRADWALDTAAFIECWTRYRSFPAIADMCHAENVAVSYHFTKDFFLTKLRRMAGSKGVRRYRRWRPLIVEWGSFAIGKHLSSATLIMRPVSHDVGARIAAEKAAAKA